MFVEFTLSEGMEQFLSCHRHALEFFGASPSKVMIDNLKTGVFEHLRGEPARFNPRYLDFAAHYGFSPVACQVARGKRKRPRRERCRLCQKELPQRPGPPRLCRRQSRRPPMGGHRRQCPPSRRDPLQTHRTLRPGKTSAAAFARHALRLRRHPLHRRQRLLPPGAGHQPLHRALPLRLAKADPQTLSRPPAGSITTKNSSPPIRALTTAARTSATPIIFRTWWSIASAPASRPSSRPS